MGPGRLVGQALGSYLSGVFPSTWGHHSLVLWDSCQGPPTSTGDECVGMSAAKSLSSSRPPDSDMGTCSHRNRTVTYIVGSAQMTSRTSGYASLFSS